MATKKFNCDICNYHSSKPYDWINHCKKDISRNFASGNTSKHKLIYSNQEIALYAILVV